MKTVVSQAPTLHGSGGGGGRVEAGPLSPTPSRPLRPAAVHSHSLNPAKCGGRKVAGEGG